LTGQSSDTGAKQRDEWMHRWVWVLFDGGIWFSAIYCATWLRFDFENTPVFVANTLQFALAAALGHFLVGAVIGPYAVGHARGSFEETTDLVRTVLVTTIVLGVWALIADPHALPHSVPVVAGALALVGMFAVRFLIRSWRTRQTESSENERVQSYSGPEVPDADWCAAWAKKTAASSRSP